MSNPTRVENVIFYNGHAFIPDIFKQLISNTDHFCSIVTPWSLVESSLADDVTFHLSNLQTRKAFLADVMHTSLAYPLYAYNSSISILHRLASIRSYKHYAAINRRLFRFRPRVSKFYPRNTTCAV